MKRTILITTALLGFLTVSPLTYANDDYDKCIQIAKVAVTEALPLNAIGERVDVAQQKLVDQQQARYNNDLASYQTAKKDFEALQEQEKQYPSSELSTKIASAYRLMLSSEIATFKSYDLLLAYKKTLEDLNAVIASSAQKQCAFLLVTPTPKPKSTSVPTIPPKAFPDIANNPYQDSIERLRDRGVITGYADGTYRPDALLTRAELLTIVVRAKHGEIGDTQASDCFSDMNEDHWAYKYVCYAKEQGVISGYPDGTFKPNQTIIFAEAVKITLGGYDKEFNTEPWYKGYMDYLNANIADLRDTPIEEKLTRGKMAHLIRKVMDYFQ